MAKKCEICGKNIGILGDTYTLRALDGRFCGYENRTACLECSDAIIRAQEIITNGISSRFDKENYEGKIKNLLVKGIETNPDEDVRKAIENLVEEADKIAEKVEIEATEKDAYFYGGDEAESETLAEIDEEIYGKPVCSICGGRGRYLFLFEEYVIIKTLPTIGAIVTGNATDGEKIIFYKDCIGLQLKLPGVTIGFIQMETASGQMNNTSSNFFAENTFTFLKYDEAVKMAYKYIFERIKGTKCCSK